MELQSNNITEITKALIAFRKNLEQPKLNKTAGSGKFSYKYADLSCVIESIEGNLSQAGLTFVQSQAVVDGRACIVTMILHTSGEWMRGCLPLPADGNKDSQEVGKSITYIKRYGLCAMLGIVAEEDTDAAPSRKDSTVGSSNTTTSASGGGSEASAAPATNEDDQALLSRVIELKGESTFYTSLQNGINQYGKLTDPQRNALVKNLKEAEFKAGQSAAETLDDEIPDWV